MSKEIITRCEGPKCKNINSGYDYAPSWIYVEITNHSKIAYMELPKRYDFCSVQCLNNFTTQLVQEEESNNVSTNVDNV